MFWPDVWGTCRYRGLPANGVWSLSLYDPIINGKIASLLSWGVRVHTGPCHRRYQWNKLTPVRPYALCTRCRLCSVLGRHIGVVRCPPSGICRLTPVQRPASIRLGSWWTAACLCMPAAQLRRSMKCGDLTEVSSGCNCVHVSVSVSEGMNSVCSTERCVRCFRHADVDIVDHPERQAGHQQQRDYVEPAAASVLAAGYPPTWQSRRPHSLGRHHVWWSLQSRALHRPAGTLSGALSPLLRCDSWLQQGTPVRGSLLHRN